MRYDLLLEAPSYVVIAYSLLCTCLSNTTRDSTLIYAFMLVNAALAVSFVSMHILKEAFARPGQWFYHKLSTAI